MNWFVIPITTVLLLCVLRIDTATAADPSLVIITSAQSDIHKLSRLQVIDIYMGRYKTLESGEHVTPIDYAPDTFPPLRSVFYKKLVNRTEKAIRLYWSRLVFSARAQPPETVSSQEEMLSYISANLNQLGYVDERMVSPSVKVVYRLNESPEQARY
ncbi:hypothetical protein NF212_03965 [Parasalinivibrio latis]|uniref:hypothetical protein n=1 Tax=Parasalinivibrio latis TaxID=2952610 RepID=UPI0030DE28C3